MSTTPLILVNEHDEPIGTAEKLEAHQQGLLHRAFSVFIFYKQGSSTELLIQQRQLDKYHCAGLWSNTCCSHPKPGENIIAAGERRLLEELGIAVKLTHAGEFHYTAHFDNGLTENEYDHVLVGWVKDKTVQANAEEIAETRWISIETLQHDLSEHPERYTPWFAKALEIAAVALIERRM